MTVGEWNLVTLVLLLALAGQIPVAVVVVWDAQRVGMDPEVWGLGILLPVAGFVVVFAYLSERRRATG